MNMKNKEDLKKELIKIDHKSYGIPQASRADFAIFPMGSDITNLSLPARPALPGAFQNFRSLRDGRSWKIWVICRLHLPGGEYRILLKMQIPPHLIYLPHKGQFLRIQIRYPSLLRWKIRCKATFLNRPLSMYR